MPSRTREKVPKARLNDLHSSALEISFEVTAIILENKGMTEWGI
jgi:hypothetical protein